ncbi:MAG: calcium-binding protein [Pseudomonadota bacterium]
MATFTVTTLADSGAGSLRQAISQANATAGRDTVVFDPGLVGDTLRLTSGEIEITEALVIDGALGSGGVLTLTGDAMGDDVTLPGGITDVKASLSADRLADNTRLFNVTEADAELTLENLVLTGGRVNALNGSATDTTANGGAVRSLADLTLSDVSVAGNSTQAPSNNSTDGGFGGGLFTAQSLSLTRTTLSGNIAGGDGGGAFATDQSLIVDSLIDGNTASENYGGVFISGGEIRDTVVTNNTAIGPSGGGIGGIGLLRLIDSTINDNRSSVTGGGVVTLYENSGVFYDTTQFIRTTVSGNMSGYIAGGVFSFGRTLLIDSTISNNISIVEETSGRGFGAGITTNSYLTLERSTISGNRFEGDGGFGGGVYASRGLLATNSTIAENTANIGGAFIGGNVELRNTTVTGNRAVGENARGGGFIRADVTLTNSLVLGNEVEGAPPGGRQINITGRVIMDQGTSIVGGDPAAVFATGLLADNGGLVATVRLRNDPANPALDAAPAATAPNEDARGLPRPVDLPGVSNGGTVDLGAFELQALNVAIVTGTDQSETLAGSALDDLQEGRGGDDTLDASPGADTLDGGPGTDTARYTDAPSAAALNLTNPARNAGSATGDVTRSIEAVLGSAFDDTLTGSFGADLLEGGEGDDQLRGQRGADTLKGGPGADTLYALAAADRSETAPNTLDGGTGADLLIGAAGSDLLIGGSESDTLLGEAGDDTLQGDEGQDILSGGKGEDLLQGGTDDDSLFGRAGMDILEGGAGADLLDGGAGLDTASYAQANQAVAVDLVDPALNQGAAAGDTYLSIEAVVGSDFADTLSGSAEADPLAGAMGDDTLSGRAGMDTLEGGAGADLLDGGDDIDTASYANAGQGVRANLVNPGRNEGVAAGDTYVSIEAVLGSDFADRLTGSTGGRSVGGQPGQRSAARPVRRRHPARQHWRRHPLCSGRR